jgi:hypothetical protein
LWALTPQYVGANGGGAVEGEAGAADWPANPHGTGQKAAGVYYLGCDGDARRVPLYLLDPATGHRRILGLLERPGRGPTVSLHGRTILYTRQAGEGSDLVLIENFR